MTESQQQKMMAVGHLVLGWMIGKVGMIDDTVCALATTLKECGSESSYVEDIIRANTPVGSVLEKKE